MFALSPPEMRCVPFIRMGIPEYIESTKLSIFFSFLFFFEGRALNWGDGAKGHFLVWNAFSVCVCVCASVYCLTMELKFFGTETDPDKY